MADLLVKLYALPSSAPALEKLKTAGIEIKRAIGPEKQAIGEWAEKKLSRAWAGPVDFFKKAVGAVVIEGSEPGVYRNPVKAPPRQG